MRLIKAIVALLFIAFGLLFAALNRQPVQTDLGLITLHASLGLSLLVALLLGVIIGGAVALAGSVLPRRKQHAPEASSTVTSQPDTNHG